MILANSEAIYLQELELAKIIADEYTLWMQRDSPFQPGKEIVEALRFNIWERTQMKCWYM